MKKAIFLFLCITVLMVGVSGIPVSASSLADFYETHVNDPLQISDGAENITVNDDGSWEITGDVTLQADIRYRYQFKECRLTVTGTADVPVQIFLTYQTPGEEHEVNLSAEMVGPTAYAPSMWDAFSMNMQTAELSAIQRYYTMVGAWSDAGTLVTVPTVRIHLLEEGIFRLDYFGFQIAGDVCDLPGDMDRDRAVDMKDVLLYQAVSGQEVLDGTVFVDFNEDGKTNTADALLLYLYVSGNP